MPATKNSHRTRPGIAKTNAKARVLLVEDNTAFRVLMADVLAREGCNVTEAFDATSMRWQMHIKALENFPNEPFDLIITDVQMPGESGLASLEWLRRKGCPIPAIVVTSFPELATKAVVNRLAATLLPKPFSLSEFREVAVDALHATGGSLRSSE